MLELKKGDKVILKGFTGIKLGVFPIESATKKTLTVLKKNGDEMVFDRKTGKQVNVEEGKEKYASSIIPDDGSFVAPSTVGAKRKKSTKAKVKTKAEEAIEEEDEEEEAPKKPAKKAKKSSKKAPPVDEEEEKDEEEDEEPTPAKKAAKKAKKSDPEPEEDDEEDEEEEEDDEFEEVDD